MSDQPVYSLIEDGKIQTALPIAQLHELDLLTQGELFQFARSIETGWLGRVTGVYHSDHELLELAGVDELAWTAAGGDILDFVDASDRQWFTAEDLRFEVLAEI